jgi:hypothetical protein
MKRPNPNAKLIRRQVVLNFRKPNGRAWHEPSALPEEPKSETKNAMKPPVKRAQKRQTRLNRSAAERVICYPTALAKTFLVEAARRSNRSLSTFLIAAGLTQAAALKGVDLQDLVPDEYERYR